MKKLLPVIMFAAMLIIFGCKNNTGESKDAAVITDSTTVDGKVPLKYGFKDLTFEMNDTDFVKLTHATFDSIHDSCTYYTINNPKYLSVDNCKLSFIRAIFFQRQLLALDIAVRDSLSYLYMQDALVAKYKNENRDKRYSSMVWNDNKVFYHLDVYKKPPRYRLHMHSQILGKRFTDYKYPPRKPVKKTNDL